MELFRIIILRFLMDGERVNDPLDLKSYNRDHLLPWKGGLMDPKLVKQFIAFLVILFGWTIVVLLIGFK
jgi:hypothetical protein